jgi:glyoxylase-like metal-dependent hydrolase (beta-lactamase superfamily II)
MRIKQYHNIYQLTYWPNLFPVNVYIVELPDRLILIDTGIQAMAKEIIAFSEQLAKPIDKILLTHCHGDHIGGLAMLRKALPEAVCYVSKRESRLLNGDFTLDADEPQIPIKGGVPKHPVAYDQTLQDGEILAGIQCLCVPGHTPGHMAFWIEAARAIIVGDALQSRGGLAVAGTVNWTFPFPALATWSKSRAIESAERIYAMSPDVIGCGHGDMIFKPEQALKRAIARSRAALK